MNNKKEPHDEALINWSGGNRNENTNRYFSRWIKGNKRKRALREQGSKWNRSSIKRS